MPTLKPQELRSESYQKLQPQNNSSRIQLIIAMDIAGYSNDQISNSVGISANRVSIIKNSPLYKQEKSRWEGELNRQVIDKKSDQIVAGDPVENELKDTALIAAKRLRAIVESGKSELAQKAASDSVLDRAGYKAHTDKTVLSVEVTEKMADRFERVLKRTMITKES